MRATLVIAARELRALLLTPFAWVLLAVLQALAAWIFLVRLDLFTALVVTPLLRALALIWMLVVPLVTMRQIAGERREGTLVLLLAAPVSATSVVLGKFLATLAFFLLALALLGCTPLALLLGGSLDAGLLAAAMLGMVLVTASFVAAGLFVSALTAQPATAAAGGVGLLLLLWLLDWAALPNDGLEFSLLAWLSPASHLDALLRGLVDTADVAYFVLVTAALLLLAVRRVEGLRTWD